MKWLWSVPILLLVIGAGIWYGSKHQTNPGTETATTTPIATEATTTTYVNANYGFAFNYPKTYGTSTVNFQGSETRDPADPNARFDGVVNPIGMTVEVDQKPQNFFPSYFTSQFAAEKREQANAGFVLSTTTVSVAGAPAFQIQGVGHGQTEEEILIDHDRYIYSLGYSLPSGTSNNVIQMVLNSFRFTR